MSEGFKNPQTIASVSAIIAVGISSAWCYKEITSIKEELTTIKTHLAAIIPLVNPDATKQLSGSIHRIDHRLDKVQDDLRSIGHQGASKIYQRLTPSVRSTFHPKVVESIDIDDDIRAMSQ